MDHTILDLFSENDLFEQGDYFQPTHDFDIQVPSTALSTDDTNSQASADQGDFPVGHSKPATTLSQFSIPNWPLVISSDQDIEDLLEWSNVSINDSAELNCSARQSSEDGPGLPLSETICILGHYACTRHLAISDCSSSYSLISATNKRVKIPAKKPNRIQIGNEAATRRATHNIIEKRYRENINKKFAALEKALGDKESSRSSKENAAPLKKSSILAKAVIYIQDLQAKNISLQGELESIKTVLTV